MERLQCKCGHSEYNHRDFSITWCLALNCECEEFEPTTKQKPKPEPRNPYETRGRPSVSARRLRKFVTCLKCCARVPPPLMRINQTEATGWQALYVCEKCYDAANVAADSNPLL